MQTPRKPRLAITIGDPAGVGPELALHSLQHEAVLASCVPVLFGDQLVLRRISNILKYPMPERVIDSRSGLGELAEITSPVIVDISCDLPNLAAGQFNAHTGSASYQFVCQAIDAAIAGKVNAVVTGPIQKEAWHDAGIDFPGHTELLGQRTRSPRCRMMLTSPSITCALVTVHVGLAQVASLLSSAVIFETIELAHEAVSRYRGRPARVTVCGLNPHAGEAGLFGNREEERFIVPAIERARSRGMDIDGPIPADTAFIPSIREKTDVYVCMYHDQGLIPLKAIAFDDAVNVTLGLPIVRTSVDHGTAGDIAWSGTASDSSMVAAILMAAKLGND